MNSVEYDKLKLTCRYWLQGRASIDPRFNITLKSLELALKHHVGYRKDGKTKESYHQLNMFSYLRTIEHLLIDPHIVLSVVLLHDLYEDYPETEKEIKDVVPDVYPYVVRISKIRAGKKISMDQYYSEMTNCPVTSIVKIVDRIHNLSTMAGVFSLEKERDYIRFAETFFYPMIKKSRRLFPELEPVYENLKQVLVLVINATKARIGGV